jgi:hypothetical protein
MGSVLECARCSVTLRVETARDGYVTCQCCGAQTAIQPPPADTPPGSPPPPASAPVTFAEVTPPPPSRAKADRPRRPPKPRTADSIERRATQGRIARTRRALPSEGSSLLTLAAVGGGVDYALRGTSITHNPCRRTPVAARALLARGQPVCPREVNGDQVTDFGVVIRPRSRIRCPVQGVEAPGWQGAKRANTAEY